MNFLDNLQQLLAKTPKHHNPTQDCINSDYNSFLYRGKNCYMTWGCSVMEDSMYCFNSSHSKDSLDCHFSKNLELCFQCLDCLKCYSCHYSQDLKNCHDCSYCYNCISCHDCLGCVGLRQKKYHILNQPYSSKEYRQKTAEFKKNVSTDLFSETKTKIPNSESAAPNTRYKIPDTKSRPLKKSQNLPPTDFFKTFEKLLLTTPRLATHGQNYENCFGDYIYDNKNCYYAFDVFQCEDSHYLFDEIRKLKDCLDCSHVHDSELCYDTITTDKSYNCNHVFWCVNSRDCEHCYCIIGCEKCFGCHYIRNKKYHILNQPYSPEEYEKKVAEIKSELTRKNLDNQNLLYLALKKIELTDETGW